MTKYEAIARQVADYTRQNGKHQPLLPWTREEARIVARIDAMRSLRLRHRRAVLKSGHR